MNTLTPTPAVSLIGLGGYAFSGKDTVADLLAEHHGWAKTYMSKPLEQALLTINPQIPIVRAWETTPEGLKAVNHYSRIEPTGRHEMQIFVSYQVLHEAVGYDESKLNPEVRRLLQALGTEVGRDMFGESLWVDIMLKEAHDLRSQGRAVAVTGIRFANELDAIRTARGLLVWVSRPGLDPVNAHVSDNGLTENDFDLTVINDGTVDDLRSKVAALVRTLSNGRTSLPR